MSRISGKLNLLQLHAVKKVMPGQLGPVECLVIPIAKNNLFVGDKGVYLDLIGFEIENKKGDSKDTHLVKQSLNKDIREKMTKEQLEAMPIIGNFQVWSEGTEKEPTSSTTVLGEADDLPFN